MTQNIFQDIKDRVDFRELVRYYGLDVNRGGFACCPFHDERTPGFKVYEDHYHCFGCGEHGDHIDFVQKIYGISNIEAAKKIDRDFGLRLFDRDFVVPAKSILNQKNDFENWFENAKKLQNILLLSEQTPANGCYIVCRCFCILNMLSCRFCKVDVRGIICYNNFVG